MRAFIVRHGNTFAPDEIPRRIGSRTDLPLVASGRAQARALAAHFAEHGIRFDRVLCSPLRRTRETAAIIAPYAEIETVDWLREIDHGPDENRTEPDVIARIGAAALAAWDDRVEAPPGWTIDTTARLSAWQAWFAAPAADTTLLVTSNGAARFALLALSLPPAKLRTGSYGAIEWDTGPQLRSWNERP